MGSGFCREVSPASVVFMGLKSQFVTLNNSCLVLGASDLIAGSKEVPGPAQSQVQSPAQAQVPGQWVFSLCGSG